MERSINEDFVPESIEDLSKLLIFPQEIEEEHLKIKSKSALGTMTEISGKYWTLSGGSMEGWGEISSKLKKNGVVGIPKKAGYVNSEVIPPPYGEYVLVHETTEATLSGKDQYCIETLKRLGLSDFISKVPPGYHAKPAHYLALIHEYLKAKESGNLEKHHDRYLKEGRDTQSGAEYRKSVFEYMSKLK